MKLFNRGTPPSLNDLRHRVRMPALPALPAPPRQPDMPVSPPPSFSYSDARPADQAVPFALKVSAGIAWRVVIIAIALYGLMMVIGRTSMVVIPVAIALLLTALTMPMAVLLNHRLKFPRALAAITTLLFSVGVVVGLLTHSFMYAPQAAHIAEQFHARLRYTGSSLAYTFAGIFAGGLAPTMFAIFWANGQNSWAIAAYIAAACVITLIGLAMGKAVHDDADDAVA